MDNISQYLPFLIPVVLIQLCLSLASLVHVLRHNNYKRGNRTLWIILSFVNIIGPLLYFTMGRGEE